MESGLLSIFGLIIFSISILVIFKFISKNLEKEDKKDDSYKYKLRGPLFTPAERSFLSVLDTAVDGSYRVLGKVRVADVLAPAEGNRSRHTSAFNKISAKHFDYVLCQIDTLDVVAVAELDDRSHNKKRAKKRDEFLEKTCASVDLPLIRFKAKRNYVVNNIRTEIDLALTHGLSSIETEVVVPTKAEPVTQIEPTVEDIKDAQYKRPGEA